MKILLAGEALFHLGLILMAAALALAVICAVLFFRAGRLLKKKFNEEYGAPLRQ